MEASQGSYPYLIGAQLWQLFRRQTRGLAAHIVYLSVEPDEETLRTSTSIGWTWLMM